MSLALKFGDESVEGSISGAIYFDAVTRFTKSLGGKVSEHPLEAGAYIVDHYINENPTFSVSAVLSHIDFTSFPLYNENFKLDGQELLNVNFQPNNISISDTSYNLIKYLPDFISQFINKTPLEVKGDTSSRLNHSDEVYNMFKEILHGVYYNEERDKFENRMTLMTLFEMEGNTPVNPVKDLVLVSFKVEETPEYSGALVMDMEFKQVTFVETKKTEAPKTKPKSKESRTTTPKTDKGNCSPIKEDPKDSTKNKNEVTFAKDTKDRVEKIKKVAEDMGWR